VIPLKYVQVIGSVFDDVITINLYSCFISLLHNGYEFTRERTNITNLDYFTLWSSESDGGEVESEDGFEEHHGARSRSKRSRWVEECRWMTLVREQQAEDAGERMETADAALYSRSRGFKERVITRCLL
jgi:hypothetical protein